MQGPLFPFQFENVFDAFAPILEPISGDDVCEKSHTAALST
jgi:hypothetical protein